MADKNIGSHKLSLFRPFVMWDQHIYEIIGLVSRHKLSIVPVLDKKMRYIGVITLHDLVHRFAELDAVENPGAIFILEVSQNDYSLSQIAQIIESNDAKVLSLYVSSSPNTSKLEITIKINTVDFSAVRQTFERYDYHIKTSYSDDDKMNKLLEDRYEEFMNYLNI